MQIEEKQQQYSYTQYLLPFNKSRGLIIFNESLISSYTQIIEDSEKLDINLQQLAKDGQQFSIQIQLEKKREQTYEWIINIRPIQIQDNTYIYYHIQTNKYKLISMKNERKKDIKKQFDENSRDIIFRFPLILQQQQCLEIEIIQEINYKYNSRQQVQFTGIMNNSSTCYMNSVFQILFNLKKFRKLIFDIKNIEENQFPGTLQELFYNLMNNKNAVSTENIIKSFKWDIEQQTIQHDVQEFWMELLKAIEQKLVDQKQLSEEISKLFRGQIENHIEGINVQFDNVNVEDYFDIQLNVQGCKDIYESLDQYCQKEILDGDNKINSDEYGQQAVYKYHKLKQTPHVLIIHLKRYLYNNKTFQIEKINDRYEYPEYLDINKYCDNQDDENDNIYKLFGVLVHRGELINHGHYYCFIRGQNHWYKFDDKIVTYATNQQVYDNNFGGKYENGQYVDNQLIVEELYNIETAYMLVYLQQNKESELLELIQESHIPNWIQDKQIQQQQNKDIKNNYIEISLLTLQSIQDIDNNLGVLYNKQASNSNINMEQINSLIDQKGLNALIPKQFTVQNTIQYLEQLINLESIYLYYYKIVQVNNSYYEQLILCNNTPNKLINTYFNSKIIISIFFIFHPYQQANIDTFINDNNTQVLQYQNAQLEQVQPQLQQFDDIVLIILKIVKHNIQSINQPLFYNRNTTIQTIYNDIFTKYKYCNPPQQFQLYFLNDLELQSIDDTQITLKHYNAQVNQKKHKDYFIILIDIQGQAQILLNKINNTRQIICKNQLTQQISNIYLNQNDSYLTFVKLLATQQDIEIQHLLIKYKDKKNNYVQLTLPNDYDDESSSDYNKSNNNNNHNKSKSKQQLTVKDLVNYDTLILFKYSAIPISNVKSQIMIDYSIYLPNGNILYQTNIKTFKNMTIQDFMEKEQQNNPELAQIPSPIYILQLKKRESDFVLLQTNLKINKINQKYNIIFINKYQFNQDQLIQEQSYISVFYIQSSQRKQITTPIIIQSSKQTTINQLKTEVISLLKERTIVHADEQFIINKDLVDIIDQQGKIRQCPLEIELKLDLVSEDQEVSSLIEDNDNTKQLDIKFIVKTITDSRKQKLSQQGIKLNV